MATIFIDRRRLQELQPSFGVYSHYFAHHRRGFHPFLFLPRDQECCSGSDKAFRQTGWAQQKAPIQLSGSGLFAYENTLKRGRKGTRMGNQKKSLLNF